MYLRELRIQNLELMKDLHLLFGAQHAREPASWPAEPPGWTVLIGRNGRGKTSILRSIAVAAAGYAFGSELSGEWVPSLLDRRAKTPAGVDINAWFEFRAERMSSLPAWTDAHGERAALRGFVAGAGLLAGDTGLLMHSQLVDEDGPLPPEAPDEEGIARLRDWLESARRRNAPHLFVAAYGNTRRLFRPGQIESRNRPAIDRLRSIFDPDYRIMGLDFDDKLGNGRRARYRSLLEKALFADDRLMHEIKALHFGELAFDDSDVSDAIQQDQTYTATMRLGEGSARTIDVPTAWLADGQQALLSWLADLIGHLMLDQKDVTDPADFEGLVLVDDIDLHIHPDWQTRLVPALKRAFPKLQFIVTTHSPLIISSLRPEEVVVLDLDEGGNIEARHLEVDPRLLTTTELYARVFGVRDTPPDPIYRTLHHYEYLARDPIRSHEEQARLQTLRAELQAADVRNLAEPAPWTPEPEEP